MVNPLQRMRIENLHRIQKWIEEAGGIEKVDKNLLMQKCILILGCTREKAKEYLVELGYE